MQFVAKGGGSANKTFLFQETRAILTPAKLLGYLETRIRTLGTSACPPYHLAIVIGGTSAELTLKTVKLASTRWLDTLPTAGTKAGHAIRDLDLERQVLEMTRRIGIGAQFGGKYFCHDVRVIRLPRHGASLPVGIGVSCSADRQILAKITPEGVFLEQLETDPARFLPEATDDILGGEVVRVDLNRPMLDIRRELSRHPVSTRLSLTGTMVVARDIAHAKLPSGWPPGRRCRTTSRTIPSTTPARPRRRRASPPARSVPPRPGAWTAMWSSSSPPAAAWSCWRRATVPAPSATPAGRMAASTSAASAARGAAGAGLHPQGRGAGVSGAWHGGRVADRGRGLPGLHRHG